MTQTYAHIGNLTPMQAEMIQAEAAIKHKWNSIMKADKKERYTLEEADAHFQNTLQMNADILRAHIQITKKYQQHEESIFA